MNTGKSVKDTVVKVVLVDDHELARQGIRNLLNNDTSIKIIGEAVTYSEAVSLTSKLEPDVVLLDIRLKKGSGIDVAKFIKFTMPEIKILILTAYDDEQYVKAMAKIGVSGYLIKTISAKQLIKAIHDSVKGGVTFPPNVSSKMINTLKNNNRDNAFELPGNPGDYYKPADMLPSNIDLTSREAEVFEHVASGLRNYEVASQMHIAVKTVEAHVGHILRKLGAKNRTQAIKNANMIRWQ